jgi:hypothetical protein
MNTPDNIWQGWSTLTHGGLLMDEKRLAKLAEYGPRPLSGYLEEDLRRKYLTFQEGQMKPGEWVQWILEKVCGFGPESGYWERAGEVSSSWTRTAITGEAVKPRHLWHSSITGVLPIFISDGSEPIGRGRGRKTVSNVLHWLRSSDCRLALLTNGRQWRLLYAALDADAWCEWDADRFLEEGGVGLQLEMLRTLIAPSLWSSPSRDQASPLLSLVLESRKGQSELSSLLGERVREAVELLIRAHGDVLATECSDVAPAEIYRAAVRVMMRLVVVLFAESRDLLPRSNDLYHRSYGVNGLLEELEKRGGRGGERLAQSYAAWPRLQSLFRLVHQGSPHPALPVPAYGGELFEPGASNDPDGTRRTLHVLEDACFRAHVISDREVLHLLQRISRTSQRIRQGRTNQLVTMPVDFSDLGSEYIGILYEGLLDFELRRAAHEDPMVFLAVGNEPVLPLSRLEGMEDAQIRSLLQKLKASKDKSEESGDDEEGSEEEETDDNEDATDDDDASSDDLGEDDPETTLLEEPEEPGDVRQSARNRVQQWAERVVIVTGLVKAPKGRKSPESERYKFESEVRAKAKSLIRKIILPGEWFLVRWGGTRKGSGTFYTRPGLSVPTVHRTLRPLAYTAPITADGTPDTLAPAANWAPKRPEEILSLKVCDPACGSGSFPVAALRFLTEALYRSLLVHGRIRSVEEGRSFIALFDQQAQSQEHLGSEMIPCPQEDDRFEPRLKARLRRHVVERCIYGVDLDPLAVELCRLALWIETMDRELPFSFLDHKIKCGNGLIGAWFDTFQHYPVMAWKNREAGDENHTNGHHLPKENRAKLLKEWSRNQLLGDTRIFLQGKTLFSESHTRQAEAVHAHALSVLQTLHELPIHDSGARAAVYKKELLESDAYRSLKQALDLWCSIWFWPVEELSLAPIPSDLARPSEETLRVSNDIARTKRFLHWELEFPDVFRKQGDGFDAIIGNPPWETAKPNSKEFFSNEDPLYRTYGKQEAIQQQTKIFQDHPDVEHRWVNYLADLKAQSNFMGYAATPFGDPEAASEPLSRFTIIRGGENEVLHLRWRNVRSRTAGFADPQHAFRYQGKGDVNLYKLFLEQGQALLREGGRMGVIVPSGIYSDLGSQPLRERFLDQGQWEWLFGFENRNKVFDIHRSFKFNPVIVQKGGRTERILTAFMRRNLEDWENAEKYVAPYRREQVVQFSPKSKSLLEIQSPEDLAILEKIYSHSVLLGDQGPEGWGVKYAREFDMTNDSKLFPPRPKWEAEGYKPDEYSRWLKGNWQPIAELWDALGVTFPEGFTSRVAQPPYDKIPIPRKDIPAGIILSRFADEWIQEAEIQDMALPLYEGRMIGQFDFSEKGWVSGKGRSAKWDELNKEDKYISPQYLLNEKNNLGTLFQKVKSPIMSIGSSTNSRTLISSAINNYPCGNSLNAISLNVTSLIYLFSSSINTFVSDYLMRLRLGGLNINFFVLNELALIRPSYYRFDKLNYYSFLLCCSDRVFSPIYLSNRNIIKKYWNGLLALTESERTRIQIILNVAYVHLNQLLLSELCHILEFTDFPTCNDEIFHSPKGFWRIDKDKDPELRQTVLTIVAFHDLQKHIESCGGDREKGLESFLNQNDGEGWMIPESIRLADYGLGHDDRAQEHQPVASRLGPRYYDWQLAQTPEESWAECHLHARNLLGQEAYDRLIHRLENGLPPEEEEETSTSSDTNTTLKKKRGRKPKKIDPNQPDLFAHGN